MKLDVVSLKGSTGAASFLPGLQCILAVSFVFFRGSLPKNYEVYLIIMFLLEIFCERGGQETGN